MDSLDENATSTDDWIGRKRRQMLAFVDALQPRWWRGAAEVLAVVYGQRPHSQWVQALKAAGVRDERGQQITNAAFAAFAKHLVSNGIAISESNRVGITTQAPAVQVDRQSAHLKLTVTPQAKGRAYEYTVTGKHRITMSSVAALPRGFQGELREYQLEGFQWLSRLAQAGLGACLADDMGLGKTIQALALLLERAKLGPALIVAPTSVCAGWRSETMRFTPGLTVRVLGQAERAAAIEEAGPGDIVVASYGLLLQDEEPLCAREWATVILDEAQAIKNVRTRRSRAAMKLRAGFRLAMSGTPVENHLGELWTIMHFLNPGLLGPAQQFAQHYVSTIGTPREHDSRRRLRRIISPFVLRRTKAQVLEELPSKTVIPVTVKMDSEEAAFYEVLRRDAVRELADVEQDPNKGRMRILAAITRLRRACCSPRILDSETDIPSSKLQAFEEKVDELVDNGHRALVFSQFVDHLALLREMLDTKGISYQYLDGATPAAGRAKAVDAFQRGADPLFLISLRAGGFGLNLTAADYVFIMDPWWNPAVEDQASDRAHRIGQQRPVTIYRFVAKATIEEKIIALHHEKRELAESVLDGAEGAGRITVEELLGLLKEATAE